jgi:hypothetical protein
MEFAALGDICVSQIHLRLVGNVYIRRITLSI